ncbi:hypothetical protein [Butyrivibrio sp.]|uniref:hypothetical protein n=1 Tax=Butyrivibrio sp. TaxID=28121 RepID=UPI0025C383BB|nr:hypothetical protein [Butyrivibrio sp.]MBE5838430.1 hypothetical protein [Butyrivibrio sp.]
MTVKEANQRISDCEDEINYAYNDFLKEARVVSLKGLHSVKRRRNAAQNAADTFYILKILASLTVIVIGIVLALVGHPFGGVFLIVIGGGVAVKILMSGAKHQDERVISSRREVDEVSEKQSLLNAALEDNRFI